MANRIEASVKEGHRKSAELIAALPGDRSIRRQTYERIAEVCGRMLSGRPIEEPTSVAVSNLGRALYGEFPRSQTLLNGYRDLLAIWRRTYSDVVSASLPRNRAGRDDPLSTADSPLDAGDRASLMLLKAALKETRLENDRLKKLIHDTIPAPGSRHSIVDARAASDVDLDSLADWLQSIRSGATGLQVSDEGLIIGRQGRPGFRVMSKAAFETIKAIVDSSP